MNQKQIYSAARTADRQETERRVQQLIENREFVYRAQKKSYLALQYFPDLSPRSALQRLNRWISYCRPLKEELEAMGYESRRQGFLKQEVKAIVRHLGEP